MVARKKQFVIPTTAISLFLLFIVAWAFATGDIIGRGGIEWVAELSYLITCVVALLWAYATWISKVNKLYKENAAIQLPLRKFVPLIYVGSGLIGAFLARYFLSSSDATNYGTAFFLFADIAWLVALVLYGLWRLIGHGKTLERLAAILLVVTGTSAAPLAMDWGRNDLTQGLSVMTLIFFLVPVCMYTSGVFPFKHRSN
jgi:hypothetical protein